MTEPDSGPVAIFPGGTPSRQISFAEYCDALTQIRARAPDADGTVVTLSVEPTLIQRLASAKLTNKLFDFSYVICGIPPQVNNIRFHERRTAPVEPPRGLLDPHAIYQGIRRPMIDEGIDGSVYVYILRPEHHYRYIPHMVCVAKLVAPPRNTVFVAYVQYGDNDFNNGNIVGWDWVKADPDRPDMPKQFGDRYEREVWSNG